MPLRNSPLLAYSAFCESRYRPEAVTTQTTVLMLRQIAIWHVAFEGASQTPTARKNCSANCYLKTPAPPVFAPHIGSETLVEFCARGKLVTVAWLTSPSCNHLVVAKVNLPGLRSMSFFPEQQAYEVDPLFQDGHQVTSINQQYRGSSGLMCGNAF